MKKSPRPPRKPPEGPPPPPPPPPEEPDEDELLALVLTLLELEEPLVAVFVLATVPLELIDDDALPEDTVDVLRTLTFVFAEIRFELAVRPRPLRLPPRLGTRMFTYCSDWVVPVTRMVCCIWRVSTVAV